MIINVKTNKVHENKDYDIIIGDSLLDNIEEYITYPVNTLIVTDTNIPGEYIDKIKNKGKNVFVFKMAPG